jgi:hypothetical protein
VAGEAPELEGGERKALEELIGWVRLTRCPKLLRCPLDMPCGSMELQRRRQTVLDTLRERGHAMGKHAGSNVRRHIVTSLQHTWQARHATPMQRWPAHQRKRKGAMHCAVVAPLKFHC